MTSNMAAETILENFEDLEAVGEEHRMDIIETTKAEVFEELKDNLRPEFLNRIDEKIMFLPLTREEIKKIAGLMLKKTHKQLARQELKMELSAAAMDMIADLGYDPQFGARPLKRVIQKELVNELSRQVLSGQFAPGETIYVDATPKGLTFSEVGFSKNGKEEYVAKTPEELSDQAKESKRKKQLRDLKKATEDVKDAVDEVKKNDPPETEVQQD